MSKRNHKRVVSHRSSTTTIDIKKYRDQMDSNATDLSKAIKSNNRTDIDKAFTNIAAVRTEALEEVESIDRGILARAFFPLTSDTEGLSESTVNRAMSVGLITYNKHSQEVPEEIRDNFNYKTLRSSSVQEEAVKNIKLTKAAVLKVRKGDGKIDIADAELMKNIPPMTDNPAVYQYIDRLIPTTDKALKDDMSAFHSYLLIHLDTSKQSAIDPISLSKSYLDYRTALLTIRTQSIT